MEKKQPTKGHKIKWRRLKLKRSGMSMDKPESLLNTAGKGDDDQENGWL